ncbi:undecaprenyldiphospho-muramoylpentapeptide beta-N-acetylglucosaminyltransferase [Catenovulum sediminis]|uniref:UDP-N-acetylglucosamine--N-acetylmuramyl-(pentapeptide) pyrophosphoryl-undecaprenol N-acetylglucosamine transferase n=1 Tax=Catenovulum sediminis TaxID=1740262 RepID=A0ABV1RGL2_9ALTE|nr:undecaprenyldiphospho-muramoylpentapeptide beta-N-acetylglucosaminyltransferase [Catenovulum sediminis]
MSKKILIMAGGTGGHIFPGLAVAEELQQRGWQVMWLGTQDRMEAHIVPQAGIDIRFIEIKGVRNKGLLRKLLTPFVLLKAICQAKKVISEFQPDVVVGFGGYVALPGGLAARLSGKRLVIHEQNAVAGLTNRILARFAKLVVVAFENTQKLPQVTYEVLGNPVRAAIEKKAIYQGTSDELQILVVGGSLGAQVLNTCVPHAIAQLADSHKIKVKHQAGKNNLAEVRAAYGNSQCQAEVVEFIQDMSAAYQKADLVICRAGALTVSEIAACGIASIFVPLPHAVDDHQTLNARVLVDENAAILLPQSELQAGKLKDVLGDLMQHKEKIKQMALACKKVAQPNARYELAEAIEQITVGQA